MKRLPWLRLALAAALAVSLLANFFLLGFVMKEARAPALAGLLADGIAAGYPEDVRAAFREQLRENRPRAGAALRELRAARRALAAAVSATPFDEAAVERALQDVRRTTEGLQLLLQDLLLEALRKREGAG